MNGHRRLTAASNGAAIFRCLGTPFLTPCSPRSCFVPVPLSFSSVIDVRNGLGTYARIISLLFARSRSRLITYRVLDRDDQLECNNIVNVPGFTYEGRALVMCRPSVIHAFVQTIPEKLQALQIKYIYIFLIKYTFKKKYYLHKSTSSINIGNEDSRINFG